MPSRADPEALESIGWRAAPRGEAARLERIRRELETGFGSLHDIELAVSIFGSSRASSGSEDYERAHLRRVSSPAEGMQILRHCHAGLCADLHKPPLHPRPEREQRAGGEAPAGEDPRCT